MESAELVQLVQQIKLLTEAGLTGAQRVRGAALQELKLALALVQLQPTGEQPALDRLLNHIQMRHVLYLSAVQLTTVVLQVASLAQTT